MTEYQIHIPNNQSIVVYLTDGTAVRFNCDYEYSHEHSISLVDGIQIHKVRIEDSDECYLELTENDSYYKKYVEKLSVEEKTTKAELVKVHDVPHPSIESYSRMLETDIGDRPVGHVGPLKQFANVDDEPENIDKDFLKAQLSVKHQSILRNVLAFVSAIAVAITFLLEKLGVI